jgi:PAS domain S-box-containing protein
LNLAPLYVGKAITAVVGSAEDITDRKKAEEELRASEHSYRMLFERNLAGVFRTTPEGRVIDCNEAFARILGYDSRREVLARSAWDLYPSRAERERFVAELREARLLTNFECALRRRDGGRAWVLENSTWIEDVEGSVVIEGTLIDFGEFRRAQGARQASSWSPHPREAGAGRSSLRRG